MIELLVLDVDGTMSNGKIYYSESGAEVKSFSVKDGLAIVSWMRLGKKIAIATGRESKIVQKRGEELGIEFIYQGVKEKDKTIEELLVKLNLTWNNVAVVGDDLNDYPLFKRAKISLLPKDGSHFLEEIATKRLSSKGGEGVVREAIEYILQEENLIEEFLELWKVK
jgi:3-deoxy-D-manno-octulosonate 8-phosphate phosphatase (KDO 8-P phosphatase)